MRLDLEYYTLWEKYDWLSSSFGDEKALCMVVEALGAEEAEEARISLLSQDVYGDYLDSMTVEAWWLEGSTGVEAVQHLDLMGFQAGLVVDELLREHELDMDEQETFESVARMVN